VNPAFGPVRTRTNGASATYNGLQTRFDMRMGNNFTVNANYTFSKTIDNASEVFSTFSGGQSIATSQNPFDANRGERGPSAFDQRHVFTANFLVGSPFFREQRGLVGKLLGGYQLNGFFIMGSGRPYTPVEAFGNIDPGFEAAFLSAIGPLRPFNGNPGAPNGTIAYGATAANDLFGTSVPAGQFIVFNSLQSGTQGTVVTGAQALQQARLVYNDFGLFTNGFEPLTALEAFQLFRTPFGNVGRNTFRGTPTYTVNLSLFKNLRFTEARHLELRAEAFNILNHRNFGVPDAVTEDAFTGFAVGTFQNPGANTGDARSLRLGLRFIF
jgi:hypothetical protein